MFNKRNSNFDERQVQTRNEVGNKCFLMLYFLLMIDLLLPNYGVEWAASQISVLVIMTLCMGYYLIRIVLAGAYVSYRTENRKKVYLIVGLLAILTTIMAIIRRTSFFKENVNIFDSDFLHLFIFLFVFFMIIMVFRTISIRKNNEGSE